MKKIFIVMLLLLSNTVCIFANEEEELEKSIIEKTNISKDELYNEIDNYISVHPEYERKDILEQINKDLSLEPTAKKRNANGGIMTLSNLKKEQKKGDYFYHPWSTNMINHGHAGIYFDNKTIIHAKNAKEGIVKEAASKIKVSRTIYLMRLKNYSANKASNAVKYAQSKVGNKYNENLFNTSCEKEKKFNCSQLVLCSYRAAGTNLDAGSPLIFTPFQLTRDSDTKVYYYQPY